jgi:hypothetical protein
MSKKETERLFKFRDVMEIASGFPKENAKIPNRTDGSGENIPNGMLTWRWRIRNGYRRNYKKTYFSG